MEVLSPKSANIIVKPREVMKKSTKSAPSKPVEKPINPDKIDDKWRPPVEITEPGDKPETYTTGKKLGKGGFAVCFEGRSHSNGQIFALKVVKAQIQQKKMLEKFRTEMQIHAKMQHPNIVEFLRAFTLQDYTYVALELCNNGSLADMVKARSCLSLPEVRRYMIQICGGVKYIHKRNVIHRDLKMGNVFIDSRMNLKIGDFGLAAVMADDQDRRTTLCGTPNYIAPEILNKTGSRGHDCKVDTWAIGVICYAMLTGRPPFQSATQQEIYNKLRTLEYEWKIDTINYIPQEAKECVASCLTLVAADRPDMDELVEHDFFKMGAIADQLDTGCLKAQPMWLQHADPRGDRVRSGYGLDHGLICAECGVGKLLDGRVRAAVGEKATISALVEIELENRQGTAPITPLPEGVLYKQFREAQAEWSSIQKHPLSARPRSRKPVENAPNNAIKLVEEPNLEGALTGRTLPPPILPNPRPVQSFAAQQRQQALPRSNSVRPAATTQEVQSTRGSDPIEDKGIDGQGLLRVKPVRARSVRDTKAKVLVDKDMPTTSIGTQKIDELCAKLIQETSEVESLPKTRPVNSLPTRSRSMRSRPASVIAAAQKTASQTAQDRTAPEATQPSIRSSRSAIKRPAASIEENGNAPENLANNFEQPNFTTSYKPRLIEVSEPYTLVPGSSHARIMNSLRVLHGSLEQKTAATSSKQSSTTRSTASQYPRVDKWVDYATKHGIAYIMTDGSLGMILKSKITESSASSCVVIRNARRHTILRARGVEQQLVPQNNTQANVEFYEQIDAAYANRRFDVPTSFFKVDIDTHKSQTAAATALLNSNKASAAQRVKEVCLLDKFGKYMNKQMGASDMTEPEQYSGRQKNHFIHFYQRMGNVGIWRFADGGLQFNFPDHTKIIIYNDSSKFSESQSTTEETEVMLDLIYLEPEDARILSKDHVLTTEALERRSIRTISLNDIKTNSLRRSEFEIVKSNEVKEKLDWIRAVIGLWIKEGGLGWTGDEKLGWSGMREERSDKKTRLQWVTVGRPGGDEDMSSTGK